MNNILITDAHKEVMYSMSLRQYRNLDKVYVNSGHSIFKYNIETNILSNDIVESKKNKLTISYEPGCLYIPALNKKNAEKRLNKILISVDMLVNISKEEVLKSLSFSLQGNVNPDSDKTQINT